MYSLRLSEHATASVAASRTCFLAGLGVWGSGVQVPAWPRSVRASFLASDGASSPCPSSAESEQARCLFPCFQGRQFSQTEAPPCGSFNFIISSGPASILVTPEVGASTCGFWGHCQPKGVVGDSQWIPLLELSNYVTLTSLCLSLLTYKMTAIPICTVAVRMCPSPRACNGSTDVSCIIPPLPAYGFTILQDMYYKTPLIRGKHATGFLESRDE